MIRKAKMVALVWILAACAATPVPPADSIDDVARAYVVLVLGVAEIAPDQVEVSEPRPLEQAEAKEAKRDAVALAIAADGLIERLDAIPFSPERLSAMRQRALRARLVSLRTQMQAVGGTSLPIPEEVQAYYGFSPEFRPLADYDHALARLDQAMPGPGTLPERIASLRASATVPPDRIESVFNAALAECRKRTVAHLELPPESIEVRFSDDPMLSGEATYLGQGKGMANIGRAVPQDVDRLLQLACHEVYPGHHTHYATLSAELYGRRGWSEYAVDLSPGPLVPVAEAVAEYGVGLAFPVEDRIAFERDTLYPLAGLTMRQPASWRAYLSARSNILGATSTVARDFLAGTIDRDTAYRQFIRYRLQTPASANQMLDMLPVVGSYIIASDQGWATIDRMMRGKSVEEQWQLLGQIEREPMLLADVAALR